MCQRGETEQVSGVSYVSRVCYTEHIKPCCAAVQCAASGRDPGSTRGGMRYGCLVPLKHGAAATGQSVLLGQAVVRTASFAVNHKAIETAGGGLRFRGPLVVRLRDRGPRLG